MIRLKAYALAALGLLSAIMAALFYREKAARETEKRKGIEQARDTEQKAVDALTTGLANEVAALEEAKRRRRARKLN